MVVYYYDICHKLFCDDKKKGNNEDYCIIIKKLSGEMVNKKPLLFRIYNRKSMACYRVDSKTGSYSKTWIWQFKLVKCIQKLQLNYSNKTLCNYHYLGVFKIKNETVVFQMFMSYSNIDLSCIIMHAWNKNNSNCEHRNNERLK